MQTRTRDIPTASVTAVARVLADLGSPMVHQEPTPGACGYTRLTYTTGSAS